MFRLLSKESNIFSIPVYIGVLLMIIIGFNLLDFNTLDVVSAIITFAGIALGYFCFNAIALNYQTHLPLFLYTVLVFTFYRGDLDIGLAVTLLTTSLLVLLLTNVDMTARKNYYILTGNLLAINFIFLPTTWPMTLFVIFHIIGTSDRIGRHLFRMFFGIFLIALTYFGVAYLLDLNSWNSDYFPFTKFGIPKNKKALFWLIPVLLMLVHAVWDHFRHYNYKSPISKFKYTFLLVFMVAQLVTIGLYMNHYYEYMLLLALPIAIILSRMLRFLPQYWMRELGLWTFIISLLLFKINIHFNITI